MKAILFLFLLVAVVACDGDTQSRKAARGVNFVPDPNYLFFKNTRQRDYLLEDLGEAGNRFLHEDLPTTEARLFPVIYDDWLNDRAYLELRLQADADGGPGQILLVTGKGPTPLATPRRLDLPAIKKIHRQLVTNRGIRLVVEGDTLEAFPGAAADHARETLTDYLRLVGAD